MNPNVKHWKPGELMKIVCDRLTFSRTSTDEVTFNKDECLVFIGFCHSSEPHVPQDVFDEKDENGNPTHVYSVLSPQGVVWREVFWSEHLFIEPTQDDSKLVIER